MSDDECGLSFECLSCTLVSEGGWCEQTMPCSFDEDCGIDGKCGYNLASSEYRYLPKSYCE